MRWSTRYKIDDSLSWAWRMIIIVFNVWYLGSWSSECVWFFFFLLIFCTNHEWRLFYWYLVVLVHDVWFVCGYILYFFYSTSLKKETMILRCKRRQIQLEKSEKKIRPVINNSLLKKIIIIKRKFDYDIVILKHIDKKLCWKIWCT